jgi:hypothetical protein
MLWDYITKPEYRNIFMGSTSHHVDRDESGRIGEGSVYYCDHGNRISEHTILDWQPFEQYTTRETLPLPGKAFIYCTYRLIPIEGGTRLQVLNSRVHGGPLVRRFGDVMMARIAPGLMEKGVQALEQRLQKDKAEGSTVLVSPVELPREAIGQAVLAGLSGAGGSEGRG